jgi:hypothetical protein
MRAGSSPNDADAGTGQGQGTTAAPGTAQPVAGGTNQVSRRPVGRQPGAPTATPSNTTAPTSSTTPTTPTGVQTVNAATPFGSGTPDPAGYQGAIFFIPDGTTKMPALGSMQPNGLIFAKELNVASAAFTSGFPGVDANKKENFAIRYKAPLIVDTEADYDFRVVSDDGAILQIDGTSIVDNDGVKAAATEKTGPVHLVKGTHEITVDYFQAKGNVALQVFCKKKGDASDKVCPTRL